jgi:hypothetical protein
MKSFGWLISAPRMVLSRCNFQLRNFIRNCRLVREFQQAANQPRQHSNHGQAFEPERRAPVQRRDPVPCGTLVSKNLAMATASAGSGTVATIPARKKKGRNPRANSTGRTGVGLFGMRSLEPCSGRGGQ